MRVGVFFGRSSVSSPAGVTDAVGAFDWRLREDLFEVAELAGGAANLELAFFCDYRDAGGVIAAILEFAESLNDDGDNLLRAYVSDDSAHGRGLLKITVQQTRLACKLGWGWGTFVPVVGGLGYWDETVQTGVRAPCQRLILA